MDTYKKKAECRHCHKTTEHMVRDKEFQPLFGPVRERKITMACNECGSVLIFTVPLNWGKH